VGLDVGTDINFTGGGGNERGGKKRTFYVSLIPIEGKRGFGTMKGAEKVDGHQGSVPRE